MLKDFMHNAKENAKVVAAEFRAHPKESLVTTGKIVAASVFMGVVGVLVISAMADIAEAKLNQETEL